VKKNDIIQLLNNAQVVGLTDFKSAAYTIPPPGRGALSCNFPAGWRAKLIGNRTDNLPADGTDEAKDNTIGPTEHTEEM